MENNFSLENNVNKETIHFNKVELEEIKIEHVRKYTAPEGHIPAQLFFKKTNSATGIDQTIKTAAELQTQLKKIELSRTPQVNNKIFNDFINGVFLQLNIKHPVGIPQLQDLKYQENTIFKNLVESKRFRIEIFQTELIHYADFLTFAMERIQIIITKLRDYFKIEEFKTDKIDLFVKAILEFMKINLTPFDIIEIIKNKELEVKELLISSIGGKEYYKFLESMTSLESLRTEYEKKRKKGKIEIKEESGIYDFFMDSKKVNESEKLFCKNLKGLWENYDRSKNKNNLADLITYLGNLQDLFLHQIYSEYFNWRISIEFPEEDYAPFLLNRLFINSRTNLQRKNFIPFFEKQKIAFSENKATNLSPFFERFKITNQMIANIFLKNRVKTEWINSFTKEINSLLGVQNLKELINKMEESSPKTKECLQRILGGEEIYPLLPIFSIGDPYYDQLKKIQERIIAIMRGYLFMHVFELMGLNKPYELDQEGEKLKIHQIVRFIVPEDFSNRSPRFRTLFDRIKIQDKIIEFLTEEEKIFLQTNDESDKEKPTYFTPLKIFQAKVLKILVKELNKAGWCYNAKENGLIKEDLLEKELFTIIKAGEHFLDDSFIREIIKTEGFPLSAKILGMIDTFNSAFYKQAFLIDVRKAFSKEFGNHIFIAWEGKNIKNSSPISMCDIKINENTIKIVHTLRVNIYYAVNESLEHGKGNAEFAMRTFFKWVVIGGKENGIWIGKLKLAGIEIGKISIKVIEKILSVWETFFKQDLENEIAEVTFQDLLDTEEIREKLDQLPKNQKQEI